MCTKILLRCTLTHPLATGGSQWRCSVHECQIINWLHCTLLMHCKVHFSANNAYCTLIAHLLHTAVSAILHHSHYVELIWIHSIALHCNFCWLLRKFRKSSFSLDLTAINAETKVQQVLAHKKGESKTKSHTKCVTCTALHWNYTTVWLKGLKVQNLAAW